MVKRFVRRTEDFVCEMCGKTVKGNGYTNHCPFCLYSKHVDVNPGDRNCSCRGMMKPVSVEANSGEFTIVHQCLVCGKIKRNKANKADSFEAMLAVSEEEAQHG